METQGQSKAYLLEMVYGKSSNRADPKNNRIYSLFQEALGVDDLSNLELVELNTVFEPDNEIQQIRFKRAFGKILGAKRDFVIMKGQIGQSEHILENHEHLIMNEEIGFKCLHYSVSEASKKVTVTIENKLQKVQTVGVKTIADTALDNEDFIPIDTTITVPAQGTKTVDVEIVDDEGWEPDEDFFIYLYDINDENKKQLYGDNTKTKVTILDDDKPGVLQFAKTHIRVKKSEKIARIVIERVDGSDGNACCRVKNEEITSCPNPAKEFQDFLPFDKEISFGSGVCDLIFEAELEGEDVLKKTSGSPEDEDDPTP
jgi:hypothetical protein